MARTKKLVTLEEFEQFIKDYPQPLKFDGMRYTEDCGYARRQMA